MSCPEADETRDRMKALGRLGGLASTSRQSPEERSAQMSRASKARWAKENLKRAAEGREPTKAWSSPIGDEDLAEWLEHLDETMPEARYWPTEPRRRQALLLMRQSIAQATIEAMNRGDR
ncbi:hypothetical protein [Agrococcus sp. ProA11]|uniref:hypothetical protein n=1 Tax=Agrococcus chionoecetis TaxID=3153752 RepID=UPI003260D0A7